MTVPVTQTVHSAGMLTVRRHSLCCHVSTAGWYTEEEEGPSSDRKSQSSGGALFTAATLLTFDLTVDLGKHENILLTNDIAVSQKVAYVTCLYKKNIFGQNTLF